MPRHLRHNTSSVWAAIDATAQFVGGPGNDITVDDASGGAWYTPFPGTVNPEDHVAFAGEDLRVLLAQFTTAGIINGQFQVQVFVEGSQGDEFRTCSHLPSRRVRRLRMSWLRTTTPTPCTMTAPASSLLWVARIFQLATMMQPQPRTTTPVFTSLKAHATAKET